MPFLHGELRFLQMPFDGLCSAAQRLRRRFRRAQRGFACYMGIRHPSHAIQLKWSVSPERPISISKEAEITAAAWKKNTPPSCTRGGLAIGRRTHPRSRRDFWGHAAQTEFASRAADDLRSLRSVGPEVPKTAPQSRHVELSDSDVDHGERDERLFGSSAKCRTLNIRGLQILLIFRVLRKEQVDPIFQLEPPRGVSECADENQTAQNELRIQATKTGP